MTSHFIRAIESNYNLRASIPFDGGTYEETILKDLELINQVSTRSSRLLDVGCGAGWHLEYLQRSGYEKLIGIDVSTLSLNEFKARLDTGNIKLINGDILDYKGSSKVDCIINLHSCLGQFGLEGDQAFIRKLYSILNDKGSLILSVFTTNKVDHLIGKFEVKYSHSSDIQIQSSLTFHTATNILTILQTFSGKQLKEKIHLYNEDEIIKLLIKSGFTKIETIKNHSAYCSVFVGQKQ